MKIAVIIATRGRPQRAGGVIECARNLLSGRHDVEFIVALDDDDRRSVNYFGGSAPDPYWPGSHTAVGNLTVFKQPRPIGVGDCWNRAARAHKADFYLGLPDDAWICSPNWDAYMVNALLNGIDGHPSSAQLGIVSWYDALQPTIASIFGMTAAWVDANGFVFDPRFPFWWGDSALVETAIFATGEGMPGTSSLQFASMPGNVNPRLRDMELWWAFFGATRHERVETARKIARQAGLPAVDDYVMASLVAQCEERDAAGVLEAPRVLATITEPKPPSPEYLVAKAAAEEYLRQSGDAMGYSGMPAAIPARAQPTGIPPT